ncbi:MAG: hypothetical protein KGZ80_07130 [Methylomonas sp.]|nr:hypothetical protein [Methylomonas sp.]PPD50530.1 MAG: hypothetical protein CTY13_01550 [Methylobacter sp.]PPD53531.1 MAG: hypothetical protein CTY12_04745 [Methylotenera sp.]
MVDNNPSDATHTVESLELAQSVWQQSSVILWNLQLYASLVIEQTELYKQQLKRKSLKATAKSRSGFVSFLEWADQYAAHIAQYHDLLNSDACSYRISLDMYKQLRHALVVQVVSDTRRMQAAANQLSTITGNNFLLNRWVTELIKLIRLDFAQQYH